MFMRLNYTLHWRWAYINNRLTHWQQGSTLRPCSPLDENKAVKMTGTLWKTSTGAMLMSLYIAHFTSDNKITHTYRLSLLPKEKQVVKVELCGLMLSEDWLNGFVKLTMLAQWLESNGETANSMLIMLANFQVIKTISNVQVINLWSVYYGCSPAQHMVQSDHYA